MRGGLGTNLKAFFADTLHGAPKDCYCFPRAQLLDWLGTRWARRNIDTIVDWLDDEAERVKLTETDALRLRAEATITRQLERYRFVRWLRLAPRLARWSLRQQGAARRWLIKRFVMIQIRRTERGR